jgi:hypothetical protein
MSPNLRNHGIATRARAASPRAKREKRELWEQIELFRFLRLFDVHYPQFKWIFAVPNGAEMGAREAADMVASGLTAGVWDVFVPYPGIGAVPRNQAFTDGKAEFRATGLIAVHYCGLWIEMKDKGRRLTESQEAFKEAMGDKYAFAICYSWIEAARIIITYLGIDDPVLMDHLTLNTKGAPTR